MDFQAGVAVVAGLVGTAAMTVVMSMAGMMGMKMDMPMILGTMLFPRGGAAWALGLMMHLMMGVAFFLIYAALFRAFGLHSALAGWGGLFGAVHGLAAGMAMGMAPMMHPRMATAGTPSSSEVASPGFMATRMGMVGPMAVVMVHALYGVASGAIYAAL